MLLVGATQTDRRTGDLISLLSYLESGLVISSENQCPILTYYFMNYAVTQLHSEVSNFAFIPVIRNVFIFGLFLSPDISLSHPTELHE
jgi:hypothetical protein